MRVSYKEEKRWKKNIITQKTGCGKGGNQLNMYSCRFHFHDGINELAETICSAI